MIRRILVFLALLFVSFFVWRWYDTAAADGFLEKVKNFSFTKDDTSRYTTTITDPDGNTIVLDDESGSTIGSTGLKEILSDTLTDKTTSGAELNEDLLEQILTPDNLRETATQSTGTVIYVDGLTGGVVVTATGSETLSTQPTVVRPSQDTPSSSLSDEDMSQFEKFISNWF